MAMIASKIHGESRFLRCLSASTIISWIAAGLLLMTMPASVLAGPSGDSTELSASDSASEASDPFETKSQSVQVLPTASEIGFTIAFDPFEAQPAEFDPFDLTSPVDTAAYFPESPSIVPHHELVFLQPPANDSGATNDTNVTQSAQDNKPQTTTDPCAGAAEKPMDALGINILLPSGLLPKDHAARCWDERNAMGPFAAARCWPTLPYFWDAPCLCYRPLYFEETNLERYGYGCCCPCWIQPAVSAAHFFGTVPCLPYCMADHCPCECEYTLGHYRPGSCPPQRYHWPSCRPIAAAAEAGVMTGLIFAIP